MDNEAPFAKWERQPLVDWANSAYKLMQRMHDQIQQLQCERKDAIEAYRNLLRKMQDGTDDWK